MQDMMENKQDMQVVIQLKKQNYAYLEICVQSDSEGNVTDARVEVFHEDSKQSSLAKEQKPGFYQLVVEPGLYVIWVVKSGFVEFKQ